MKRLPKSLSLEAFRAAWKDSKDSKGGKTAGAPGVDGVRAAVFAGELNKQITEIRYSLQRDAFQFSPLRLAPILKKTGGYRIIAIPTIRDRLVQRVLLAALESDARFKASSDISYGFRKGWKLADAQLKARSIRETKPWVLQADIVKFFDRIQRTDLHTLIKRKVRGKALSALVCAAVECEIEIVGGKGAQLVSESGIKRGLGLRQGMPVSPMLSNLLLKDFDEAIIKQGLTAVRYADDLAIFGNNKEDMERALTFVQQTLRRLKLEVPDLGNEGKTTIKGPSESIEFLGVEILREGTKYKLAAPFSKLEKIEMKMKEMASVEECVRHSRNIGQVVASLDSFIIGHRASMAVLDDPNSFFDRLEAAKRRQLSALLTEVIGERAVRSLNQTARAILGIERFE